MPEAINHQPYFVGFLGPDGRVIPLSSKSAALEPLRRDMDAHIAHSREYGTGSEYVGIYKVVKPAEVERVE